MEIITKQQFFEQKTQYIQQIKEGAVFVYPTDTIYGIGCDATNKEAVEKIRLAKQRDNKPFSVIAPSKEWIKDNCDVENVKDYLEKLPGPYTFILKLKNKDSVAKEVSGGETIGVRIPDNWISQAVAELGKPLVTTSVNISGQEAIVDVNTIPEDMHQHLNFAIEDGILKNSASQVWDLTKKEAKRLR